MTRYDALAQDLGKWEAVGGNQGWEAQLDLCGLLAFVPSGAELEAGWHL